MPALKHVRWSKTNPPPPDVRLSNQSLLGKIRKKDEDFRITFGVGVLQYNYVDIQHFIKINYCHSISFYSIQIFFE